MRRPFGHVFQLGNWPDFRQIRPLATNRQRPLAYTTYWCHGAPGIALSRLRAYQILQDETCHAEALNGLQTTNVMIKAALSSGGGNFSLCHGLAGNADVLLQGAAMLQTAQIDNSPLIREVADTGLEVSAERGLQWLCGLGAGDSPSLMLGLAGIGYFYLRALDGSLPSVLLPSLLINR